MTAPPDQATAGWSRSQRRWIGSVPTQDSDRGCSEWAVQQTGCAGGIAHIQACAAWARHGCFGSRGCSGLAMPLPRTHASRHTTRTTGSSRPCDRRPARDRVGDPRCCSRWGCNSGPERKPAHGAIVGAGRQPSLLSGISDRQLPVDGAVRMPRTHASRHTTRTTGSSRPCDRRPARDRVGDPRCCSRWGCNSGPERKPAHGAIVGAGRQPSLLSGISDRQLPVDGAVRMPRIRSSGLRSAYDPVCGRLACESPRVASPDRAHETSPVSAGLG